MSTTTTDTTTMNGTAEKVDEARRHLDKCQADLTKHRAELDETQARVEELERDASGVTAKQYSDAKNKADYLRASLGGKLRAVNDARSELQRATVEDVLHKVHGDADGRWGIGRLKDARTELRAAADKVVQIIGEYNKGRHLAFSDLTRAGITVDNADPFVATFASPSAGVGDHDRLTVMGEEIPPFALWPDLCGVANDALASADSLDRLTLDSPARRR